MGIHGDLDIVIFLQPQWLAAATSVKCWLQCTGLCGTRYWFSSCTSVLSCPLFLSLCHVLSIIKQSTLPSRRGTVKHSHVKAIAEIQVDSFSLGNAYGIGTKAIFDQYLAISQKTVQSSVQYCHLLHAHDGVGGTNSSDGGIQTDCPCACLFYLPLHHKIHEMASSNGWSW